MQIEDDFRDLLIPSFSEADLEAAVAYCEHVAENDLSATEAEMEWEWPEEDGQIP